MTKTLLDKAKEIEINKRKSTNLPEEEIELAIAWMKDEITLTQGARAMGYKNSGAYLSRVAILLRGAYRAGILKVKER